MYLQSAVVPSADKDYGHVCNCALLIVFYCAYRWITKEILMALETSLRPKLRPKKKKSLLDFGKSFVSDLAKIPSSIFRDLGMGLRLIDRDAQYYKSTLDTRARMHREAAERTRPTSRDDDSPRTVSDVMPVDPESDELQMAADALAKEKAKATEDQIQQALSKRFRSGTRGRRSLLRSRSGGGFGFYNRFQS